MPATVNFSRSNLAMRAAKHCRTLSVAIVVCAVSFVSACKRTENTAASGSAANSPASPGPALTEPPFDQQIEQKLDPLTKDDVELYLKVMRAAAERVKHPTPADQVALEDAKKILGASGSGHVPTRDDAKALDRANLVALSMDQIVAEEMKLDARDYRGIAEAIEAVVPGPTGSARPGTNSVSTPTHSLSPLERRLRDVNAANAMFLAPYRVEIGSLITIVRAPANLPQ
jgi:hypothetical protein